MRPFDEDAGRRGRAAAAEARARRKAEGLPATRTPVEAANQAPGSLRLAIRAMCWECEGRDEDPHVKWRIGNCQITDCPLWRHRPYQKQAGTPIPTSLQE